MCSVKIFVIFAVATLNLAVMSRCVGLYEFVPYAPLFEARLKQWGRWIFRITQSFCELLTVIRLNTLYLKWETLLQVF